MVTQVDPWNPRKVGRRESAPRSCPLTHTCMLLHTHPISSYRYIRTNNKIKNKIIIQWFSVCHKAIPLCTIKYQDISLVPGKTWCHEQYFFIIPLPPAPETMNQLSVSIDLPPGAFHVMKPCYTWSSVPGFSYIPCFQCLFKL